MEKSRPPALTSTAAIASPHRSRRSASSAAALVDASLLTSLYDAVGNPAGWANFMEALAQAYPGGRGLFAIHDATFQQSHAQAGGGWEPDAFAAYNQHFVAVNPWIPSLPRRPIGRVVPAEFMLPQRDLIKTEFYSDFLRPAQLDSGVGVTVEQSGTRHMIVSILFPQRTAEHDGDAVGRLQRLVPHLLRVAQLNRQFGGLEARALAAETALDRLATALIVVHANGRIVYLNPPAERIIAAGDGLTVLGQTLATTSASESQALQQLIKSAALTLHNGTAAPGGVMRLSRTSGGAPYEVLVTPLPESAFARTLGAALAAVFVRDPETKTVTSVEWLQHLHRLSPAEARLMQTLLAGDSLDDAADRLGVGKETVRSQLKAIFLKTGTNNQGELIRLALRGVAIFRQ